MRIGHPFNRLTGRSRYQLDFGIKSFQSFVHVDQLEWFAGGASVEQVNAGVADRPIAELVRDPKQVLASHAIAETNL